MSFLDNLLGGVDAFVTGYNAASAELHQHERIYAPQHLAAEHGRIERFCRELGWRPKRHENGLWLEFNVGRSEYVVSILDSDEEIPSFLCVSNLTLPPDQVPPKVYGFLLNRNSQIALMAWHVIERSRDGLASFAVRADVCADGLNASLFKHILTKMAEEVAAFDELMRSAGLLG